jgi:secondary thiamine-phosphate synthase enzyme
MSSAQATLAVDRASGFRVVNRRIPLQSDEPTQFVDITDQILTVVRESGIANGAVVVYAQHTTAGITINEAEPLLLGDMCRLLDRFASREDEYQHDDLSIRTVNLEPNERKNGHAHCQRLFIGASESIPLANGDVQLGKWQRVFFVELDGPRPRSVTVQVMGI